MAIKPVILDRDGVINEDSDNFIRSVADWRPIPGSVEAIAQLSRAGFCVLVATNQSGIGRGLLTRDTLEAMHTKFRELVYVAGGRVDGIYYCPHLPTDNCSCRKPGTGLLESIAHDFGTTLAGAPMIGDSLRDLEAGVAMGCAPILVRTGKGAGTERQLTGGAVAWHLQVRVFDNLAATAAALIGGAVIARPGVDEHE